MRNGPPFPEKMEGFVLASTKEPSEIAPGPDGSKPLSYPILIQPVLDRRCIECHNAKKPEGKVILTGEPEGTFTKSYNALIRQVAYTAWGMPHNNYEPLTEPDRFGAPKQPSRPSCSTRAITTSS